MAGMVNGPPKAGYRTKGLPQAGLGWPGPPSAGHAPPKAGLGWPWPAKRWPGLAMAHQTLVMANDLLAVVGLHGTPERLARMARQRVVMICFVWATVGWPWLPRLSAGGVWGRGLLDA